MCLAKLRQQVNAIELFTDQRAEGEVMDIVDEGQKT